MSEKFFKMDNDIFKCGLSPYEFTVYLYLVMKSDRKTMTCFPSVAKICVVRKKLLDEMMLEILYRAVELYRNAKDVKSETPYLASCIFRTLIDYDAYIERLFRQHNN